MQSLLMIPKLIEFVTVFSANYYLRTSAGAEIIISRKNHWWIGIKNSIILIGVITTFLVIVYAVMEAPKSTWQSLAREILTIAIPITGVWLWAAWRVKLRRKDGSAAELL